MDINSKYLQLMYDAKDVIGKKALMRIRVLWWDAFIDAFSKDPDHAIDNLDLFMDSGQKKLRIMASEYSQTVGAEAGSPQSIQRINQFLKSNTGKMFERFIGLAIAYYLKSKDSDYCVWAFRKDLKDVCKYLEIDNFKVQVDLGKNTYETPIDSDLIIFKPEDNNSNIYLISVKSTLKDRFHNVPFWNLLRLASLAKTPPNLYTKNDKLLKSVKYIAACSDLAEEQPDFRSESGPRNLLCLDAALLDGAYVTASKARGLGNSGVHLGANRGAPFYPLSKFVQYLCN